MIKSKEEFVKGIRRHALRQRIQAEKAARDAKQWIPAKPIKSLDDIEEPDIPAEDSEVSEPGV